MKIPETTPKKNPRALEIMKLILLVVILSFVGAFTQDRKIADHLMRTNRCYPECLKSCPTFNFPEPETTAKGNSRALKMMKLISLVVILSFLGIFAQDRKIPDDLMRTYPCYPGCITEFEECINKLRLFAKNSGYPVSCIQEPKNYSKKDLRSLKHDETCLVCRIDFNFGSFCAEWRNSRRPFDDALLLSPVSRCVQQMQNVLQLLRSSKLRTKQHNSWSRVSPVSLAYDPNAILHKDLKMKVVLIVILLSFFGESAQNQKIGYNIMWSHCSKCAKETQECYDFYSCMGRPQPDKNRCLTFCVEGVVYTRTRNCCYTEPQRLKNDETCLLGPNTFILGSVRAGSRNIN
uniref:Uncharacterized protein n=1 Tax=Magallana gigas TaxID=29159 RepID=A0A8W8MB94_MAGGI